MIRIPKIRIGAELVMGTDKSTRVLMPPGETFAWMIKDGRLVTGLDVVGISRIARELHGGANNQDKLLVKIEYGCNRPMSIVHDSKVLQVISDRPISIEKLTKLEKFIAAGRSYLAITGVDFNGSVDLSDFTLRHLIDTKTNDYTDYESLVRVIVDHDINTTDFSSGYRILSFPKIRVVIPCHNSAETIAKLIESIRYQTGFDEFKEQLEVIIIDDGGQTSFDMENIKAFESKVNVISTYSNVYCGQARNIGYSNFSDGLIITLDSDLRLQKNYIYNHIARYMLYQNVVTVSNRQNIIKKTFLELPDTYEVDITEDSRWEANYPADYLGGSGSPFLSRPLEETENFRKYGFGRQCGPGIGLSMMVKGHNFCVDASLLRQSGYCDPEYVGWGDDDNFLGMKLIGAGGFVVPVLATGVAHCIHAPRFKGGERGRLTQLEHNVRLRNLKASSLLPAPRRYL